MRSPVEGTGLAPLTRYPLEADLRYVVSLGSTFIGIANLGTSRPRTLLARPRPTGPVVLAGDFNLHHPKWDQFNRYERKAEPLLELALQWDLDLQTPRGTVTRAPQGGQQGRPSTIDHFWTSTSVRASYSGVEARGRSDHYPQVLDISLSNSLQQRAQPEGWSWKMADYKRIKSEAKGLLLKVSLEDVRELSGFRARVQTQGDLDQAFDWLVEELTRIAEASAPRKKLSRGFRSPWWSARVAEAAKEARQAERAYRQTRDIYHKGQLSQCLQALTTVLQTEKTRAWRSVLHQATQRPDLLWSLERWARCRSFRPPDPPKIPALAGPPGQPELTTHTEKAAALATRFFPSPPADLSDIHDPALVRGWETRIPATQLVTPDDIHEVLSKAGPWKAPGEDNLPMGLLKACGKPLCRILAVLATKCLELGWFPNRFKRAKTVVLQKPGKAPKTYQTLGGYRPIALLPNLGKVIEAIVARKVTKAAEAASILPDEQMGNREHRSTELAVRLVVAQVQEA